MGKLYPPVISGSLPAFYGTKLKVPFQMNNAVGKNEFRSIQIKLRHAYDNGVNSYLYNDTASYISREPSLYAVFDIPENKIHIGESYKVQIAYVDNSGQIGHYSTVGIVKYTSKPTVSIDGLTTDTVNKHNYIYQGYYSQSDDKSEKVYSYKFDLQDQKGNIVDSSGWLLHNSNNDVEIGESTDQYEFGYDLEKNKLYFIQYIVRTINNLEVASPRYSIQSVQSISPEIKAKLIAQSNYYDGNIELFLEGEKDSNGLEYAATGSFRILRSSSEDNYGAWNEILKFQLFGQQPSRWLWQDFTVKQGISYKYALQQYNDYNVVSDRLETEAVYVDFEDAFLYDGERQLKIRFNSQVSDFKNTILENKVDTIGNKYPFIFRNGNVKYKEFPISGLISYHMDDNKLFTNWNHEVDTNLTGENIANEREFKLEVLEWLNNGQPKLFKSPTEGNYIVRLMNVSLSPEETLGRMLHTFKANAYEIAEFNFNNLSENNIINVKDPTTKILRWHTADIKYNEQENVLKYTPAHSIDLTNVIPGEQIKIVFTDKPDEDITIVIGATGGYKIDLREGQSIESLSFVNGYKQGDLTYSYYGSMVNEFNTITDVNIIDIPAIQIQGPANVFSYIENVKRQITNFNHIHSCSLKDISWVYADPNDFGNPTCFRYNEDFSQSFEANGVELLPSTLYLIRNDFGGEKANKWYIDNANILYPIDEYDATITINGNRISLLETGEYAFKDLQGIESLEIGCGVQITLAVQLIEKTYSVEKDVDKTELNRLEEEIRNLVYENIDDESREEQLQNLRREYAICYAQYLFDVEQKLKEQEEANGILV